MKRGNFGARIDNTNVRLKEAKESTQNEMCNGETEFKNLLANSNENSNLNDCISAFLSPSAQSYRHIGIIRLFMHLLDLVHRIAATRAG